MVEDKKQITGTKSQEVQENENVKVVSKDNFESQIKEEKRIDFSESIIVSNSLTTTPAASRRTALTKIVLQLSEEELANSGVQKLIIDDLMRLESENSELKQTERLYHLTEIDKCILEEKVKSKNAMEFLIDGCLALGGAICGFAIYFFDKGEKVEGTISLVIGVSMILIPTIYKILKKKK